MKLITVTLQHSADDNLQLFYEIYISFIVIIIIVNVIWHIHNTHYPPQLNLYIVPSHPTTSYFINIVNGQGTQNIVIKSSIGTMWSRCCGSSGRSKDFFWFKFLIEFYGWLFFNVFIFFLHIFFVNILFCLGK